MSTTNVIYPAHWEEHANKLAAVRRAARKELRTNGHISAETFARLNEVMADAEAAIVIDDAMQPLMMREHRSLLPTVLTKPDCVRRARNLNQQAVAYDNCGKPNWAKMLRAKRDRYMSAARLMA